MGGYTPTTYSKSDRIFVLGIFVLLAGVLAYNLFMYGKVIPPSSSESRRGEARKSAEAAS